MLLLYFEKWMTNQLAEGSVPGHGCWLIIQILWSVILPWPSLWKINYCRIVGMSWQLCCNNTAYVWPIITHELPVGGGGGFSKVVATFSRVDGSFNLFLATTGDVWIIPSFRIWYYGLHAEHVSCVITNCGQHQWVIPSPLSISLWALLEENTTRKLLSLSLDLFFKILLFQVTFLIFFSIAILSPYFLQVGLLLQCTALFQSGK